MHQAGGLHSLLLGFVVGAIQSAAFASTETLPAGIYSPSIRLGVISGLDQTYSSDGRLYRLGDTRSLNFDAATLSRTNKDAETLIRVLDSFGSQGLGKAIHLGRLQIDTRPEVHYQAPVIAYGVTDRWTLGVGIPLVRYRNQIRISTVSSPNLEFYRSQFSGLSNELDRAFNIDLAAEAGKTLAAKGYKPLEDRDQSFVGDIQLASLYRSDVMAPWKMVHQIGLTLPTGPKDDPNDLMALNTFGRTVVENSFTVGIPLSRNFTFAPGASLSLPLPDQVSVRVPRDEDDALPDESQIDRVDRWIGPTVAVATDGHYSLTRQWGLSGGLESSWKQKDSYGRSGKGRSDVLARGTATEAHRLRGGVSFSSVKTYLAGQSLLPSVASFVVSDTVAGRTIERQLRTELNVMLFF